MSKPKRPALGRGLGALIPEPPRPVAPAPVPESGGPAGYDASDWVCAGGAKGAVARKGAKKTSSKRRPS